MRLGVVIPARNEEGAIAACLASLAPFFEAGDPVVVADDGSSDGTAAVAAEYPVRVLRIETPGRGLAVAAGWDTIEGSVDAILIGHADMNFPPDAREAIVRGLVEAPTAVGGSLGHRIDDPRRPMRWIERGNAFRARVFRLPYGDQAQFFRVEAVRRSGGLPRQGRLEDLELALRLRAIGPFLYLDRPVTIPARHWEGGWIRATVRNWLTVVRYRARRKKWA